MSQNYFKTLLFTLFACTVSSYMQAQVTIGNDTPPETFSILQIEGNTGGVRLPQLNTQQRNNLTPLLNGNSEGDALTIFNTTLKRIEYWNGANWAGLPVTVADNALKLEGISTVKLGGELCKNTTIEGKHNSLYFDVNTGNFAIGSNILTVENGKIGIGTSNAQGLLHIDAKSNNNQTPTEAQLADDVIISQEGKIGIGTMPDVNDPSLLQVNGPITINNAGTISAGGAYVLTTDDGSGQARWKRNIGLTQLVIGQRGPGYNGPVTSTVFTTSTLTLPPGEWIIQTAMVLTITPGLAANQYIWGSYYWADNNIAQNPSTDIFSGKLISSIIPARTSIGMAFGLTYIRNSTGQDKTYYLMAKPADGNFPANINWHYLGGTWGENSIAAFPVNGAVR